MKIGIDTQATIGRATGLGVYTKNLVCSLREESANGFQFTFYNKDVARDMNTLERWMWGNFELLQLAKRDHVDVLHVPAFAPPFKSPFRSVVTVHDLIGMVYPNQLGLPSRIYWGKWLPLTIRNADALIADSEHTKQDILKLLHINERKIHVVYPSGHEHFSPQHDRRWIQRVKDRFGIKENYFLFVGTVEPRKNLRRVIRSFANFLRQKSRSIHYQLVVVGLKTFAHGQVVESLKKEVNMDSSDIVFTDYTCHEDLNVLYSGAQALVFPSLYEGFGIPILEAMASGVPVFTSNVSSLPEVGGDAVLYVNPYNQDEITDGLIQLAENEKLRNQLIKKGYQRMKRFSWRKTARETLNVYESVS